MSRHFCQGSKALRWTSFRPLLCPSLPFRPSSDLYRNGSCLARGVGYSTGGNAHKLSSPRTSAAAPETKSKTDAGKRSPLTDSFGRFHDYLRISVTEHCNLRCQYCMPEDYMPPAASSPQFLTTPEIVTLARLFVAQGVRKIRLTGGEPTVRPDIIPLVQQLGQVLRAGRTADGDDVELCMTTNGLTLPRKLPALVAAGVTGFNISLDTLDPHHFQIMTRRRGWEAVWKSIHTILEKGEAARRVLARPETLARPKTLARPVEAVEAASGTGQGMIDEAADALAWSKVRLKINCVMMKGINDEQLLPFVELTRAHDVDVRFIEYMPFDGNRWKRDRLLSYRDMIERVRARHPSFHRHHDTAHDTSKHWRVEGFRGRVGFITSMTHNFCGSCNRLRITSDGQLKVCLFDAEEVSLRDLLRPPAQTDGAKDISVDSSRHQQPDHQHLLRVIQRAVYGKKARHAGMGELEHGRNRPIVSIGTAPGTVQKGSTVQARSATPYGPAIPKKADKSWIHEPLTPTPLLQAPLTGSGSIARWPIPLMSTMTLAASRASYSTLSTSTTLATVESTAAASVPTQAASKRSVKLAAKTAKKEMKLANRKERRAAVRALETAKRRAEKRAEKKAARQAIAEQKRAAVQNGKGTKVKGEAGIVTVEKAKEESIVRGGKAGPSEEVKKKAKEAKEAKAEAQRLEIEAKRMAKAEKKAERAARKLEKKERKREKKERKRRASEARGELPKTADPRTAAEGVERGGTEVRVRQEAEVPRATEPVDKVSPQATPTPLSSTPPSPTPSPPRSSSSVSLPLSSSSTTTMTTKTLKADSQSAASSARGASPLSHLRDGAVHMISVGDKPPMARQARAIGRVFFSQARVLPGIRAALMRKGDVLAVARVAAIMAAKKTSDWIPLCHPVALTNVSVDIHLEQTTKPEGSETEAETETRFESSETVGLNADLDSAQRRAAQTDTPTKDKPENLPPVDATRGPSPRDPSVAELDHLCIEVTAACIGPTGVEMEALTGAAAGALTVYDMCKSVDPAMEIRVELVAKTKQPLPRS